MAHCPYSQLRDLEGVLAEIRTLEAVREKSPAVFYVKSKPFLHFHVKDGDRWADARCGANWGPQLPIPPKATATVRARFLSAVKRYHAETLRALQTRRRPRRG